MSNDTPDEAQITPISYPPALAAGITGRSRSQISKAIGNGELVAKDGRATLIERSELERWVKALPVMGASEAAAA